MSNTRAKSIAEVQAWLNGLHANIDADNASMDATTSLRTHDANATELEQTDTTRKRPRGVFLPAEPHSLETTVLPAASADALDATGAKEAPPPPGISEKDVLKAAQRVERDSYQAKLQAAKDEQRRIDEARKREEAQQTAAQRTTREAIRLAELVAVTGSRIFRQTRDRLGQIPTPGDIIVPLSILLLFFFILFPVNGHTRLTWLWLTITKNANIGGALPAPVLNPVTPQAAPAQTVAQQLQAFATSSIPLIPTSAFNNPPPPGQGPSGNSGPPVPTPNPGHAPGHGPHAPGGGGPSGNGFKKMSYAQMMQEGL